MSNFGVIVDGFSSGRYYVEQFKQAGLECLHLQSRADIPRSITGCFCDSAYRASSVHESLDATAAWIERQGTPAFVVPGCEIGVNLADALSARFQLPSRNDLASTEARRNKFLMMERVRNAGLRAIKQLRTKDVAVARTWIASEDLTYPVVVKPLASTSGEGFSLCEGPADVERAFEKIVGHRNILNLLNEEALVQEFIRGEEFVVDTVSVNGSHVVSDGLKYEKSFTPRGESIYRACAFLSREHVRTAGLEPYAFAVLDALGVANGPAHVEIMVDAEGPVLIEVGARLAGCMLDPALIAEAYGHSQVSLSALAYASPSAFAEAATRLAPSLRQELELVYLATSRAGVVSKVDLEPIKQLRSHRRVDCSLKVGATIGATSNLSDAAAIIYLMHPDRAVVDSDKRRVRELEPSVIEIVDAPAPPATGVYVDDSYLNYAATLCGAVKTRSYELCGVPPGGGKPKIDILDVGCGPGIDTVALAEKLCSDSRIEGVDRDPGMVTKANERAAARGTKNVAHRVQDSEQLVASSEFDCVRCERLLQHLADPSPSLRGMVAALRPGGKLVVVDTAWSTLRSCALSESDNAKIARHYATTLTNADAVESLPSLLRAQGVVDVQKEVISVRLEKEDYLKITKGPELLQVAFGGQEAFAEVWKALEAGESLPMYATVDLVLVHGIKPLAT